MTLTNLSKAEILAEKQTLDNISSSWVAASSKHGTWAERLTKQTTWKRAHANDNAFERRKVNDSILNNPVNIERWEIEKNAEEQRIKESERVEKLRLANIELEKQKILKEAEDLRLNTEFRILYLKDIEEKRLAAIQIQEITFNEQTNSGDFNETPITDINLSGGCSECTEPEHQMPDGSMMKDSDMEKKPLNNNMKFVGIAAIGLIGLMVLKR